jgi:glycosyltransferase involved in cell wall biosynthesis
MIGADGALAALIEELWDNPETCARMGEAARQLMIAEYSRDQAADAWCALIWRLQNAHQLKTSIA